MQRAKILGLVITVGLSACIENARTVGKQDASVASDKGIADLLPGDIGSHAPDRAMVDLASGDRGADLADLLPPDSLLPDSMPPDMLKPDMPNKIYISGCSDGTREGFTNIAAYPKIAGCSGGWSVAGLLKILAPQCKRIAGNSSTNPTGKGCVPADICAAGWTICLNTVEVLAKSPTGCKGAVTSGSLFFATRQSSTGCGVCATGTSTASNCTSASCAKGCLQTPSISNDIFGCGTLGAVPNINCAPFDRFSQNLCNSLGSPWSCGNDGYKEAHNVVKSSSKNGGVICCRD